MCLSNPSCVLPRLWSADWVIVPEPELLDEHGRFDLVDIRNRGLGHLIKSLTVRQERTNPGARDEEPRYADVIRIELHDAQKSDEILGRYLGMERTPVNLSVNVYRPSNSLTPLLENPDDGASSHFETTRDFRFA